MKERVCLKPKITLLSTVLLLITATYPKHYFKFQYKALEMLIKGDKLSKWQKKPSDVSTFAAASPHNSWKQAVCHYSVIWI